MKRNRARTVGLAAVLIVGAGCSGTDGGEETVSTLPAESTDASAVDGGDSGEPPFTSTEVSEPLVPSDSLDTDGSDDLVGRMTFDGVTFAYDSDVIEGIIPARIAVGEGDGAVDADQRIPADVRFEFRVGDNATSSLTISALADRGGVPYPGVSPELRAAAGTAAVALDSRAGSGSALDVLHFVNGAGVFDERVDGSFSFTGMTDDRRFVVVVESSAEVSGGAKIFADLVGTLFIDVGADALNVPACADDAFFVSDQTVPQGAVLRPGEEFVKVWRFRNTGTCTWDEDYSLAFGGGTAMTIVETGAIARTEPGDEVDLNVTLMAPDEPGPYGAQWQLIGPTGIDLVGPPAVLFINVENG